jgi:AcrR family transcriptional regulator
MARTASDAGDDGSRRSGRQRLRGEDRREALVAAAARLLASRGIDAISMETVAAGANVSRPLVYKHFANRDDLLAEVYRQQAAEVDAAIVAAVTPVTGFDAKVRAMIRAVLESVSTHGPIFAPLDRAGLRGDAFRREQRARDERTVRSFARMAMAEYDLEKAEATAAIAILLTGMASIRAQWQARPTAERLQFLEDLYVDLVTGGLASLASRRRRPA